MSKAYTTLDDSESSEKDFLKNNHHDFQPNSFQTPNILIDEIAPKLKEGELRVILYMMRKTFGWNKNWEHLTLEMIETGTGMKRKATSNGIKGLIRLGYIEKIQTGPVNHLESYYRIVISRGSNNVSEYPKDTPQGYPKDTPPIINKDIYKKTKGKDKEPAPPSSLPKILKFGQVKLKEHEYEERCKSKGKEKIDLYIQKLNDYADMKQKKFQEYTNHAKVLDNWMKKDEEKSLFSAKVEKRMAERNREYISKLSKQDARTGGALHIYDKHVELGGSSACNGVLINFDDEIFMEKVQKYLISRKLEYRIKDLQNATIY